MIIRIILLPALLLAAAPALGQELPDGVKIEPMRQPKAGAFAVLYKEGSDRVPVTFEGASRRGGILYTLDEQPNYTVARVEDPGPQENTRYIVPANARPARRFVANEFLHRVVLSEPLGKRVREAVKEAEDKVGRLPKKKQRPEKSRLVGAALARLGIPARLHPAVLDAL